jgi:predicted GIY-YIG superfamily endonuclease
MYKIYQAKHVPTGKMYIGVTKAPLLKRIGQHLGLTEYKQGKFQQFLHTTQYSEWEWSVIMELSDRRQAYKTEADLIKDAKATGHDLLNSDETGPKSFVGKKLEWLAEHQFKKGQTAWNAGKTGVSDETREKMRVARLRSPTRYIPTEADASRTREAQGKKIICIETGVEYPSIGFAAQELGLHRSSIRNVLQGKQTYAGGFTFRYVEQKVI